MSIPADVVSSASIRLLGGFELDLDGERRAVPHSVERLLGYLALAGGPVRRCRLAADLWYDTTDSNAAGSLRTAVWRLRKVADRLVVGNQDRIALSSSVLVDVHRLVDLTEELINGRCGAGPDAMARLWEEPDLLPSWPDPWLIIERERLRLLVLAAFESAAEALLDKHLLREALLAALEVVRVEPLRESGQRLVVRIQLADGNVADALRTFQHYQRALHDEMRLCPSRLMSDLIDPILTAGTARYRQLV